MHENKQYDYVWQNPNKLLSSIFKNVDYLGESQRRKDISPVSAGTIVDEPHEYCYKVGEHHFLKICKVVEGGFNYSVYGYNYRLVDEGKFGDFGVMSLKGAIREVLNFYQLDNELVTEISRKHLETLNSLYNPALEDKQILYMGDIVLKGYDPQRYKIGDRIIDLTSVRLTVRQIDAICCQNQYTLDEI